MMKMEIHPGEGGADAVAFAHELATAISKHTNQPVHSGAGTTLIVDCL